MAISNTTSLPIATKQSSAVPAKDNFEKNNTNSVKPHDKVKSYVASKQDCNLLMLLFKENEVLRNKHQCKAKDTMDNGKQCDNNIEVANLPCGHVVHCLEHAQVENKCSSCNQKIDSTVLVRMS